MSVQDENRMLYVLHKTGVSRKHIKWIMNDIRQSCVFGEYKDEYEYEYEDDFLEEQAYWLFNKNVPNSERKSALERIRMEEAEYEKTKKSQYFSDQEERIQAKIKEMVEKGLVKPESSSEIPDKKLTESITRYGRSPLHEAIAMRDINLVTKYLKMGKYLEEIDNNGHSAMEMAYYDNYKEALILFEKYGKAS
jgi:ankyrin repeat protein